MNSRSHEPPPTAMTPKTTKAPKTLKPKTPKPKTTRAAKGAAGTAPVETPNGPTLDGLRAICSTSRAGWDHELFDLVDPKRDAAVIAHCRDEYSVDLIGRSHDQLAFFGVPRTADAETVDQRPVVLVDNEGSGPEVATRCLADFLSLIAYAPAAWGDSPKRWRECAADSVEHWPKDTARLQKLLCTLPGVELLEEPWKLQRHLPKVTYKPLAGSKASARLDPEAFATRIQKIFAEETPGMDLLFVFDVVQARGDELRICLIVDAPLELRTTLAAHPLIRAPLAKFLLRARTELPERKLKIALSFENLANPDAPDFDPWRTFRIALKAAGKPELYATFEKERAR